jgi:hypothetical protein
MWTYPLLLHSRGEKSTKSSRCGNKAKNESRTKKAMQQKQKQKPKPTSEATHHLTRIKKSYPNVFRSTQSNQW